MTFFFEVLIGGLLSGVMYSLVALGFVLIYKASGVFNFAQGAMVFFAALTYRRPAGDGTAVRGRRCRRRSSVMVVLGARHRALRAAPARQPAADHAVHGDASASRSSSKAWRSSCGAPTSAASSSACRTSRSQWIADSTGMNVSKFDLVGGRRGGGPGDAAGGVLQPHADRSRAARAWPTTTRRRWPSASRCSRSGRSSWGVAGAVALVAGLLWGARNGVQYALTFVALKALPVLILGGFESIPGAIVGGLIIGATEKLAEVYLGPFVGGGIEGWFPYVLALVVPARSARGPVRREDHPAHLSGARPDAMFYREAGQFKTSYAADAAIFPILQDRIAIAVDPRSSRSSSCRSSRRRTCSRRS